MSDTLAIKQLLTEFEVRMGSLLDKKVSVVVHEPLTPNREHFYKITTAVCCVYNVPVEELFKATRLRKISDARHMSMSIIRQTTRATLKEIGDFFNRDHTSVIHACDNIKDRIHIKDEKTVFVLKQVNKVLYEA